MYIYITDFIRNSKKIVKLIHLHGAVSVIFFFCRIVLKTPNHSFKHAWHIFINCSTD